MREISLLEAQNLQVSCYMIPQFKAYLLSILETGRCFDFANFMRRVVLVFALWGLTQLPLFLRGEVPPEELVAPLQTLDLFMISGKEENARRGARLLDMYETSPKKAEREIESFFQRKKSIFSDYVSISKDIYGFQVKENGYHGTNISMEGAIETTKGFSAEFSARVVFRGHRWRIISMEID